MQSHGIDQECQLLNLDEFQLKETEVAKKSKCVVSRSHKSPHIVSKRNAGAGTLIALVGMDGQMHWAGVVLKADGKKKKKKDDQFQSGYLEVDSLLDVTYATRHSKTVDSVIVTEGIVVKLERKLFAVYVGVFFVFHNLRNSFSSRFTST